MNRGDLDSAILAMLRTATTKQIGDADTPNATPTLPYAISYPSASPGPYDGDYADPESMFDFEYILKCVGETREQCQWMADKVRTALTARAGGSFVHAMAPTGMVVVDRCTVTLGATLRTGDHLFETNDIYRVRVSS